MENGQALIRKGNRVAAILFLTVGIGGCAQTVVQPKYEQQITGPVVRPSQVLVYDFAISDADVRENQGFFAAVGNSLSDTTKNDRELAITHRVQNRMVEDLIAGIRDLGLRFTCPTGGPRRGVANRYGGGNWALPQGR
jgi:hypothetical protein